MTRRGLAIATLVAIPACTTQPNAGGGQPQPIPAFRISTDFAEESAWVEPYLISIASSLNHLMDNPAVAPPEAVNVTLTRDPDLPGIGGFATPESIGFVSDQWPKDANRLWILAHELVNLYANRYAGGGGFPSDFWSNGRSPFPEYASCIAMREAGYPEEAVWRKVCNKGKPDHDLYWALHERYSFDLFARFFKLLRDDGVIIADLGTEPWPAPDRTRSLYTIGYLSIAAGENLNPLFREAGIGREPTDWQGRHPEVLFREYTITDAEVAAFMLAHE